MSYKIDRLDDFGRGIVKVDNKVCFIKNALEEEVVEIDITNEKSKYSEGVVKKYLKTSPDRVDVKCPFYCDCGGCNIMHTTYINQLKFKKEKIKSILSRYAKVNNVVSEIIKSSELNYRNKVTLKVKDGILGYFKDKSYELINIDNCLICNDKINEVIKRLNTLNLKGINEIVIRCNYKDEILIYLMGNIEDLNYYIDNLDICDNIVVSNYKSVKAIKGNDFFIDSIGDYLFRVSYNSFFQVNKSGVKLLYDKVAEYAGLTKKENVLDLYCGTGTIGIYLSKNAKKVIGVEINQNAVNDANYNKELNNIDNIEFICKDVSLIKEKYKNIDLVVVDPPRSGLKGESIYNVLDINPKKIIYVSCDPITLARDLKILKTKYNVKDVTLVDMFPNTYHCESITILERK